MHAHAWRSLSGTPDLAPPHARAHTCGHPSRAQKFWVLETVARIPYFAYISILHLYESVGFWRAGAELRKIHLCADSPSLLLLQLLTFVAGAVPAPVRVRRLLARGRQAVQGPLVGQMNSLIAWLLVVAVAARTRGRSFSGHLALFCSGSCILRQDSRQLGRGVCVCVCVC